MMLDICWLLPLLLLGLAWGVWIARGHQLSRPGATVVPATVHRRLKPRTPHDCPTCRQHATHSPTYAPTTPRVRPWCERKSRRGAPKRINTHGFACPTRTCEYYRIMDPQVHALVGDGTHGKRDRIQTFRCQACRTTFSARRHTPLYRLKTPAYRVGEVLTALAEGLDISAAVRVFGYSEGTITRWLTRAGDHSATLHDHWFRQLYLSHLQLDELRTRLRCRTRVLALVGS